MHAVAAAPEQDASGKRPVPQILSNASPGRLEVLGKREIEWDEELGYLAMADFDDDPDLQVNLLKVDLSDKEVEAGPSDAPVKSMPAAFYLEVAKFLGFLKLFPPLCIVAGCQGRMAEKSINFIGQTLSLHVEYPHGHSATWRSARKGTFTMVPELNDKFEHSCCTLLCLGLHRLQRVGNRVWPPGTHRKGLVCILARDNREARMMWCCLGGCYSEDGCSEE